MIAIHSRLQGKVKVTHVAMESAIIVLAALVFFPLSKNTQRFDQNCLLNSDIFITRHSNESVSLDLVRTVFGDPDQCDYTTFFNVLAACHGLIWIWFFFHIDSLRSHNGSAVNLLLPALLTHTILLICAVTSSIKISAGFNSMCSKLENNNGMTGFSQTCKDYESLSWTENRSNFYTLCYMALICSWILVVAIILSVGVTFVHLYWDFSLTSDPADVARCPLEETSGYADDGMGVINKGALSASDENLLSHLSGGRDIDSPGTLGERGGSGRNSRADEMTTTADVHGPSLSKPPSPPSPPSPLSRPSSAELRNRAATSVPGSDD